MTWEFIDENTWEKDKTPSVLQDDEDSAANYPLIGCELDGISFLTEEEILHYKLIGQKYIDILGGECLLFGSSMFNCGVPGSDIDISVDIHPNDIRRKWEPEQWADDVAKRVEESGFAEIDKIIPTAKHPVVKCRDLKTQIPIDLSRSPIHLTDYSITEKCYIPPQVANTRLIKAYTEIDCRARQLIAIIKRFAANNGINSAFEHGLNSFAYTSLCIFYLQNTSPPVLPCLTCEGSPLADIAAWRAEWDGTFPPPVVWPPSTPNTAPIEDLVSGFFRFYANYYYPNSIISIRTGKGIHRKTRIEEGFKEFYGFGFAIEDPFLPSVNTAQSVVAKWLAARDDCDCLPIDREDYDPNVYYRQYYRDYSPDIVELFQHAKPTRGGVPLAPSPQLVFSPAPSAPTWHQHPPARSGPSVDLSRAPPLSLSPQLQPAGSRGLSWPSAVQQSFHRHHSGSAGECV
eukprot:GCRY01005154.1.p1 GENE.GCRY01005154.1~~GCRY01005154.1.p1  ORF type:complete len:458 (-),score=44.23 GCRY01005154.1:87-1460(-)